MALTKAHNRMTAGFYVNVLGFGAVGGGVITITFDATNLISTTKNLVEFYSQNPVDPR